MPAYDYMSKDALRDQLRFYIGNLRYNLKNGSANGRREFNEGRLEAYEDALQLLTGSRGEDIE